MKPDTFYTTDIRAVPYRDGLVSYTRNGTTVTGLRMGRTGNVIYDLYLVFDKSISERAIPGKIDLRDVTFISDDGKIFRLRDTPIATVVTTRLTVDIIPGYEDRLVDWVVIDGAYAYALNL